MNKTVFFFALVLATQALAEDATRCGTDDFGNTVCMDKNGVITMVSRPFSNEGNGVAVSGVPAATRAGSDNTNGQPRCGIDPFGNRVCR